MSVVMIRKKERKKSVCCDVCGDGSVRRVPVSRSVGRVGTPPASDPCGLCVTMCVQARATALVTQTIIHCIFSVKKV